MTRTALITVAHGRHDHLAHQHRSVVVGSRHPGLRVVVAMDDPTIERWRPSDPPVPEVVPMGRAPLGLPLAAARNLGARRAIDWGADLLVFLDVDCLVGTELVAEYTRAAGTPAGTDALLCGPVAYLPPAPADGYDLSDLGAAAEPHPGRPAPEPGVVVRDDGHHELFWSLSFAVSARTWEAIGGFDEGYVGYGAEDTDFAQRAATAGVPIAWVGGARAFHQHHAVSSPPVEHVADIVRNARRFSQTWGWWPMRDWLEEFVTLGMVQRAADGSYTLRSESLPGTGPT